MQIAKISVKNTTEALFVKKHTTNGLAKNKNVKARRKKMEISKGVLAELLRKGGYVVTNELLDMTIANVKAEVDGAGMIGGSDILAICSKIADIHTTYAILQEVFRRNNCHVEREEQLRKENAELKARLNGIEKRFRDALAVSFPHYGTTTEKVEQPVVKAVAKATAKPAVVTKKHKNTPHDTSKIGKVPVCIHKSDLNAKQISFYNAILSRTMSALNISNAMRAQISFSELFGYENVHKLARRYQIERKTPSSRTTHSSAALLCAYYGDDENVAEMVEKALK